MKQSELWTDLTSQRSVHIMTSYESTLASQITTTHKFEQSWALKQVWFGVHLKQVTIAEELPRSGQNQEEEKETEQKASGSHVSNFLEWLDSWVGL